MNKEKIKCAYPKCPNYFAPIYFYATKKWKETCCGQCGQWLRLLRIKEKENRMMVKTYPMFLNIPKLLAYSLIVLFLLSLTFPLFGQTSLTVMQGDTIEFRATQVIVLDDGSPIPDGNILLYHIHIIYEDGVEDMLIHNNPMQFPGGTNIIIEANATGKVGIHRIEAWPVRVKPSGSAGKNNIAAKKRIMTLTVEANIDDRAPAEWIITIHPKGGD